MTTGPRSSLLLSARGVRSAWFAVACLVCGCSGGRSKDITFGGALLPSSVRVAALGPIGPAFAAVLPEQGRVVIVDGSSLEELSPPPGCSSPVAVQTSDVDMDGALDVLIVDSACGGWLALSTEAGWQMEPWDRYLPVVPAAHYLFLEDLDGDGDSDIAAATPLGMQGFARVDAGSWRAFALSISPPNVNQLMAREIGLVTTYRGETVLALQQPGQLTLVRFDRPEAKPLSLPQSNLELLKTYEGFDQLTTLPAIDDCNSFALGAGFFVDSGRAPKPLVGLTLLPESFEAMRIATQGSHVIALALVALQDRQFVGLIGGSMAGFSLEVLERVGCDRFESRVSRNVAFDVEGVVALPETPEELAGSSGETLLGGVVDGRLLFVHFDGANLRRFEVDPETWLLNETILTL